MTSSSSTNSVSTVLPHPAPALPSSAGSSGAHVHRRHHQSSRSVNVPTFSPTPMTTARSIALTHHCDIVETAKRQLSPSKCRERTINAPAARNRPPQPRPATISDGASATRQNPPLKGQNWKPIRGQIERRIDKPIPTKRFRIGRQTTCAFRPPIWPGSYPWMPPTNSGIPAVSSALDSNDHRLSEKKPFSPFLAEQAPALGARCSSPTTRPGSGSTTLVRASLRPKIRIASPRRAARRDRCGDARPARSVTEHLAPEAAYSPPHKEAQSLYSAVRDLFVKKALTNPTPPRLRRSRISRFPGFGSLALLCAAGQRALSSVTRGGRIPAPRASPNESLGGQSPPNWTGPDGRDWAQVEEWQDADHLGRAGAGDAILFRLARE